MLRIKPLAAIALIMTFLLLGFACDDSDEDVPTDTPSTESPTLTATVNESPTATPTSPPTATPTASPQVNVYRNEKYGYKIELPEGWRSADDFMTEFATVLSDPSHTSVPDDYAVVTSASAEEEHKAIDLAKSTPAIGIEPWYRFAEGHSVHLRPSVQTLQAFSTDINEPGLAVTISDVIEVTLDSGETATRLTRRTQSDNGDLTFDSVYVPIPTVDGCRGGDCVGLVIEILQATGYDQGAFEEIYSSFSRSDAAAFLDRARESLRLGRLSNQVQTDAVPFSVASEGISLEAPADWRVYSHETAHGYWSAWVDSVASTPSQRSPHAGRGSKIQLQVFHFLPPDSVQQRLEEEANHSGTLLESREVIVGGESAHFVDFLATEEDARTKIVSFVSHGRWYHLTLNTFAYSTESVATTSSHSETFQSVIDSIHLFTPSASKVPGLAAPNFLILPAAEQLTVVQGWIYNDGGTHYAIDYVPTDTGGGPFPVTAAADGTAIYRPGDNGGYGNFVSIYHPSTGYYTLYGHLDSSPLPAFTSTPVSAGQQIGIAGHTGYTVPPDFVHLHFELALDEWGTYANSRDPYDIYGYAYQYPAPCGPNHYWTTCPPTFGDPCGDPGGVADGGLYKEPGFSTVFITYDNTKYAFHSDTDFNNMGAAFGFDSGDIVCVPAGYMNGIADRPPNKTLVREFPYTGVDVASCRTRWWINSEVYQTYYSTKPIRDIPPRAPGDFDATASWGCHLREHNDTGQWYTCNSHYSRWFIFFYASTPLAPRAASVYTEQNCPQRR